MTAFGLFLSPRRFEDATRTAARRAPLWWPIVVLAVILWGVGFCAAADAPVAPPDWHGRSRAEVVDALGKPLSALQRGDTEVLMYANSVRFEIRGGVVVSHRSGENATIVASDGTRYTPTDRGKVQRVAATPKPVRTEADEDDLAAAQLAAPAAQAADTGDEEDEDAEEDAPVVASAKTATDPNRAKKDDDEESWKSRPTDNTASFPVNPDLLSPEHIAEHGLPTSLDEEEEKPEPRWVRPVRGLISALLRFAFAFAMLRIAISYVGLPCYSPDVAKVAALYVVVREGMYALGDLGGHWEWIHLMKIADGVSFVALMYLLYRFKVALSGLTALKIAAATKGATFLLMAVIGMGISLFLSQLY